MSNEFNIKRGLIINGPTTGSTFSDGQGNTLIVGGGSSVLKSAANDMIDMGSGNIVLVDNIGDTISIGGGVINLASDNIVNIIGVTSVISSSVGDIILASNGTISLTDLSGDNITLTNNTTTVQDSFGDSLIMNNNSIILSDAGHDSLQLASGVTTLQDSNGDALVLNGGNISLSGSNQILLGDNAGDFITMTGGTVTIADGQGAGDSIVLSDQEIDFNVNGVDTFIVTNDGAGHGEVFVEGVLIVNGPLTCTSGITASAITGNATSLRLAESTLGILQASPVGGNNGANDILTATSSYEGQIGIAYYGNKQPFFYFANKAGASGSQWTSNGFNFPNGINQIGSPGPAGPMDSISRMTLNVNGNSSGNSSGNDSGLAISNYSTSSTNSGVQVILNIMDATGSLISNNGCAWAHVPSNRKLSLIPGWNYMVYNSNSSSMRGFAVCGAGIGPSDGVSGNYSILQCDLINKLFRIPLWFSGSYQPVDANWQDAFTVNPSNGNITNYGTASFAKTVFITGSLNAPIITGSLFGTSSNVVTSNLPYRSGQQAIGNLATTQNITFSSVLPSTSYAVSIGFDSTIASAVSVASTGKTIGGFTASLSAGIAGGATLDYIAWLNN